MPLSHSPEATPDAVALAERVGASAMVLEVVANQRLSASMRRISLHNEVLATMEYKPGQDLLLTVGDNCGTPARRRYTIRRNDRERSTVDLDVVLHGDGPGVKWAAAAEPGVLVEAIGPRGKVTLVEGAEWHLFVGDESFVPATEAMTEALPPGKNAIAVLEVDSPEDEVALPPAVTERIWLHRDSADSEDPDLLSEAVAKVEIPEGNGHVYLAGEMHSVSQARKTLLERGVPQDRMSPQPYWRKDMANQDHGEPDRS